MNELRQLLHDTAATEPPDHLDLGTVMLAGRRRRQHRRAVVVGVAATATAAAVAIGTTVAARTPDAGPAPAGNLGRVITLDDARPAVEGTDYRVLATRDHDQDGDERIVGVTDDGLGVVLQQGASVRTTTQVGLVDPADGTTRWLPGGPQQIAETATVALGVDRLVFRESHWSDKDLSVRIFDRAAGTWSTMSWPGLPRAQAYNLTPYDGRLYLKLLTRPGDPVMDLWSVSLDDSADVRDEHRQIVSDLDVTGDELTWLDEISGTAARVVVRDLTTGEERSIDPQVSADCGVHTLERVGDRLLLGEVCGGHDDQLQVVTMAGDPVLTVDDVGGNIGDGGQVAVVAGGAGGPFVLDPVTGELWKVGDPRGLWVAHQPVPDGSDLTLWSTEQVTGGDTTTEHFVEWLS